MTGIDQCSPDVSVLVVAASDPVAARAVSAATASAIADLEPYLDEPVELIEVVADAITLASALRCALGSIVVVVEADVVMSTGALSALVAAAVEAPEPAITVPVASPTPCAALPSGLLATFADAVAATGSIAAAVELLTASDVPWQAVLDADTRTAPRRPEPRVVRPAPREVIPPAWTPDAIGPHLDVAHPDAVTVGAHTYFQPGSVVKTYWPTERVHIGAYCCIAAEVHLVHGGGPLRTPLGAVVPTRLMHSHHPATATSFPIDRLLPDDAKPFDQGPFDGSLMSRPLVIGSDVWLGYRSLVYGPVTVGHGAIVGVGSVVTGDVPPYAVVAGNPATVVRMRFSPAVVERLLALAWWDWPEHVVRDRWAWFTKPIAEFLALAEEAEIPSS